MVIISKKRLIFVLSVMCLVICTCIVTNEIINENKNAIETVALPVTNKVIVIDAGHGKPDEGAQSSNRYSRSPD